MTQDTSLDRETATLTADAVIFAEGHVLLIKRGKDPFKGRWALPGGHVNPGETFEQAARRELAEEAGLGAPATFMPVWAYGDPGRDPRGRVVSVAHVGHYRRTPAVSAADDAVDARWIPVADVHNDRIELAFDHSVIVWDAWQVLYDEWPRWKSWRARLVLGGGRRG